MNTRIKTFIKPGLANPDIPPEKSYEDEPVTTARRCRLTRGDFEAYGTSLRCPGCKALSRADGKSVNHTEACRSRIEAALRNTEEGRRRLEAADWRVNEALSEAHERQEAKNAATQPPAASMVHSSLIPNALPEGESSSSSKRPRGDVQVDNPMNVDPAGTTAAPVNPDNAAAASSIKTPTAEVGQSTKRQRDENLTVPDMDGERNRDSKITRVDNSTTEDMVMRGSPEDGGDITMEAGWFELEPEPNIFLIDSNSWRDDQADVSEIYSRPRIVPMARKMGLA